jgi:peptide/nickel transport system ATP-binding protein
MSTLRAHALRVALDTDAGLVRALDGLSLAIERGETFALVGESGCGKSMTALALLRLLPDNGRVEGGRVMLDDADTLALPEAAMRRVRGRRIGMIFQEPATSLNPVMQVGAQIIEAIETHTALRGAAARERAVEWLRRVGIPEPERRIDSYPFELSGGQKQRVMIAMALAAEPDFLLADEPTTALDVTIQKQILDLLQDLQRERGLGLLLITHDLAVVAGMAHRVALMYAGQIVEVAPAAQFFAQPRHPYARLLLQALPDARRHGAPLTAIGGSVPPLWSRFEGCRFAPRCDRAEARCRAEAPALTGDAAGQGVRCFLADRADGAGSGRVRADAASSPAVQPRSDDASGRLSGGFVLDVRDLRVRYARSSWLGAGRGDFTAVDGVSLAVRAGQTLALVGESGCGKSTLGRAVMQLLRGKARVSGQALLDGQDLFDLHGEALQAARREIQIVFQDPFASLNPRLRVQEILEEGMAALRPQWAAPERQARLLALVERVGLRADALGRYPHEFSGGQRQRIAIARALAVEPRVLVCDEPTSALDVSVQAQILNLLRELQAERGLAYLFITHNIGVVEYLADEVAVMRRGRIVEAGPARALLAAPQDGYTQALLAAVPRLRV